MLSRPKMEFKIKASEDSEMWELWAEAGLCAVVHESFFTVDTLSLLQHNREQGDTVTDVVLEVGR